MNRPRFWRTLAVLALPACSAGADAFLRLPLGAEAMLPVPAASPLSCAQVALGRRLFFETRLSASGETSCATCHVPARAFTDGRSIARGDRGAVGRRNSPTLLDRAYGRTQFLDGRAATLEQQALLPLTNPVELANSPDEIVARLSAEQSYRRAFARVFGSEGVSLARLASAIASFERTLVAGDSPVDRALVQGDSGALPEAALRGLRLFLGKANCVVCHEPPRFTEERFHNTGVAWKKGALQDSGRYSVTHRAEDLGAFKTPTLRNVELTAPYMHDGSLATLEDVVAFYNRGGNPNPNRDPLLRPLDLSAGERAEVVEFLRSLTGPQARTPPSSCP